MYKSIGPPQITAYGDVDIALSSSATNDLNLSVASGSSIFTTPLDIDPSCCAVLPTRNVDVSFPGAWSEMGSRLVDTVVISRGNTMAMGIVGQDANDTSDVSFVYAAWQKTEASITRDDFLGSWDVGPDYGDVNLSNTADGFDFETIGKFASIVAGSSDDKILLNIFGEKIELQVNGNRAFLPASQDGFGGTVLSLDILHGGDVLLLTGATAELFDETDVSLGLPFTLR